MSVRARILLILAEKELAGKLSHLLAVEGVEVSSGAEHAMLDYDLIVMDSLSLCDRLRRKGIDTSILILTDDLTGARVAGLRLGADDCVSRNCDPNELLARIEALLRRVLRVRKTPITTLRFGDVEIDFAIAEARRHGHTISMASKELRLLQYLIDHRDRVVSRQEILGHVWEYDSAVSSRTIDVHIGWLRQKLEDDPQRPKYIKTIRGRGYRFDLELPRLTSVSTRKQPDK